MNLIQEFALLFAVATPVVVILSMNLMLMLEGETGTLIFPSWPADLVTAVHTESPRAPAESDPANDAHYPEFRHAA